MRHEYEKSYEHDGFVLPIPCVRSSGFDPKTFLETLASYWNQYFSLNRARMQFSVLKNWTKMQTLFLGLGAASRLLALGL